MNEILNMILLIDKGKFGIRTSILRSAVSKPLDTDLYREIYLRSQRMYNNKFHKNKKKLDKYIEYKIIELFGYFA